MKFLPLAAATAVLGALAVPAHAQALVPPGSGVLTLTASASIEVTKDVLGISFSATREGPDAHTVQSALKQALDAALVEARRSARPGQVEVQTGAFSLFPRYANSPTRGASPVISGWQGHAELIVQGKETSAIAELTGRIHTMTIARVGYTLSREAREKVEAEAVAQAIGRWRAQAQQMSQLFGYTGYTVREVTVTTNEPRGPVVPVMRAQAMAASGDVALPVEAGQGEVTATVSGAAQMTK